MINKKLQVALSKLLKIDEKVLEAATDLETGDESILKEFTNKNIVHTVDDLAKLISNSNIKFQEEKGLVDPNTLDIGTIPKLLYVKLKGTILQLKESEIAKKYGVEKYDSLDDLIAKLTEKSNNGKGKDPDKDLLNQIDLLKKTVEEKENELKTVGEKAISDAIMTEYNSSVNKLPLDYDDDTLPKQRELLNAAFMAKHKVVKKGDVIVVLNDKGEPLRDKLAEPLKVSDVVKSFAEGYGFKFKSDDPGGRGAGSSSGASSTNNNYKGKTWAEILDSEKLTPNSDASDKVYAEWKAANKT